MKCCTQCKLQFTGNATRCPLDGAPLVDMPDPLTGRTIGGRYRIESKIGAGGMASVYRASHDLLGRKVAIKFLSPELALDGTQRERFLREARATNRIKHENIVDISDYGEEKGLVYLVMELLEGEPLSYHIARGQLALGTALDYTRQTARALARAHELEVIHRDLKPENIFLVPTSRGSFHVKLLDFGLAHLGRESRLTAHGAVFGTPEYMSPEQATGRPVGPASDIYALGVVLFEMLTQNLPFEGSTAELLIKHRAAPPPTASSMRSDLPREVDALVARMLAKDSAQRHRDAYHLIDELSLLIAQFAPQDEPRRHSGEQPVAGTKSGVEASHPMTLPTTSPTSTRTWQERKVVYREAVRMAYPAGNAPSWVAQALERIETLVTRAEGLEPEAERVARTLAEREDLANATRDRIGRALDELARDESVLLRQIEDLGRKSEKGRQRATALVGEFQKGWLELMGVMPQGQLRLMEDATAAEALGRKATAWRQSQQELQELERVVAGRRGARDDLRFQVTQLKGRLGAMNAEVEHDLAALRQRSSEVGAQLTQVQEHLTETGAALAQHLLEFPASRAVLAIANAARNSLQATFNG